MNNPFRRNRDDGDNGEPEDSGTEKPSRPFSSSRIDSGDAPARPGGLSRPSSGMFNRNNEDNDDEGGGRLGGNRPSFGARNEERPAGGTPFRRPGGGDEEEGGRFGGNRPAPGGGTPPGSSRPGGDQPSRFGSSPGGSPFRRGGDDENKEEDSGSRFGGNRPAPGGGTPPGSSRPGGDQPSRFGSSPGGSPFRRGGDDENKEEDSGSRFGGNRPAPGGGAPPGSSRPGGDQPNRFGSSPGGSPFRRGGDDENKEEDSGSRFGGNRPAPGGGAPPGSSRPGGDQPSRFGSPPAGGATGSSRAGGDQPNRFGSSSPGGGSAFRRPGAEEEKKDEGSGSRFGSLGGGSGFRRPGAEEEKKDAPPASGRRPGDSAPASDAGGTGSRLGGMFGRRGGEEEKKDAPPASGRRPGDSAPASDAGGTGSRLGGMFGRRGGEEEKKDAPPASGRRPGDSAPASDAGGTGSRLGGMFGRRGGAEEEKKDAPPAGRRPADSAPASDAGGTGSRLGGMFGRRGGEEEKKDAPPASGRRPGGSAPASDAPATSGSRLGGLFGRKEEPKQEDKPARPASNRSAAAGGGTAGARPAGGGMFGSRTADSPAQPARPGMATGRTEAPRSAFGSPATKSGRGAAAGSSRGGAKPASSRSAGARGGAQKEALPTSRQRVPKVVNSGISLDAKLDMVGFACLVVALVLVSALVSPGSATARLDNSLSQIFGVGRVMLPVAIGGFGIWLLIARFGDVMFDIELSRIGGIIALYVVFLATLQWGYLFSEIVPTWEMLEQNSKSLWDSGGGGGWVGHQVYITSAVQLGDIGVVFFFVVWWIVAIMFTTQTSTKELADYVRSFAQSMRVRREASAARKEARREGMDASAVAVAVAAAGVADAPRAPRAAASPGRTEAPAEAPAAPNEATATRKPAEAPKSSFMGRRLQGDTVVAEGADAAAGARPVEDAAKIGGEQPAETPGRRFGGLLGGRKPTEEAAPASAEKSAAPMAGALLGEAAALRKPEEDKAAPAGRRLFGGRSAPAEPAGGESSGGEATDAAGKRLPDQAAPSRLGGLVGRFGRKPAEEEKSEEAKPAEGATEATGRRLPFMNRGAKPESTTPAESPVTPAAAAPVTEVTATPAATTAADSSPAAVNRFAGLAGRFGRKPAEEEKSEEAKPEGSAAAAGRRLPFLNRDKSAESAAGESAPASEAPAGRFGGLAGRFGRKPGEEGKPAETSESAVPSAETPPASRFGSFANREGRTAETSDEPKPEGAGEGRRLPSFNREQPAASETPAAETIAETPPASRFGNFANRAGRTAESTDETKPEGAGEGRRLPSFNREQPAASETPAAETTAETPPASRFGGFANRLGRTAESTDETKPEGVGEGRRLPPFNREQPAASETPAAETPAETPPASRFGSFANRLGRTAESADEAKPEGTGEGRRFPPLNREKPAEEESTGISPLVGAAASAMVGAAASTLLGGDGTSETKPAETTGDDNPLTRLGRPTFTRPETETPTRSAEDRLAQLRQPRSETGESPLRRPESSNPFAAARRPAEEKPEAPAAPAPAEPDLAPARPRFAGLTPAAENVTPPVIAEQPVEAPAPRVEEAASELPPARPRFASGVPDIQGKLGGRLTQFPIHQGETRQPDLFEDGEEQTSEEKAADAGSEIAQEAAAPIPPAVIGSIEQTPAPTAEIPAEPVKDAVEFVPFDEVVDDTDEDDEDDEETEDDDDEVINLAPARPRGISAPPVIHSAAAALHKPTTTPIAQPTPPVETPKVEPAAAIPVREEAKPAPVSVVAKPVEADAPATWKMPAFMDLLEPGSEQEIDQKFLLEQARLIEDTLVSFGAPGKVVEINSGPVITQFGVEPDYLEKRGGRSRVKVSSIAALDKDLALALAARTIRIEAPVPGKGFVGIEVPNAVPAVVSLRDIMVSEEHQKAMKTARLVVGLGQSVDGTPVSADLTNMPHMLIAGTTGSGKSVCVNAIIGCLLLQNSPDDLQLIMVDPKRVELTGYNGIPHLISNVVVDLERIVGVLKWVQREMDERYKKLAERVARNIEDYNRKVPVANKMPYLVVIIDELADLMMLAPDETEKLIARLAQMSRATGIHMIISTQRPSVDVVTGLIKANFPARIAFAVASGVDSRVILDAPGADRLLGKGDMLFQAPDASSPLRMQGVYVSDTELERITRFWKEQALLLKRSSTGALPAPHDASRQAEMPVARGEKFNPEVQRPPVPRVNSSQQTFWNQFEEISNETDDDDEGGGEDDDMYEEAVKVVRNLNKASVSLLQRRLRIGYTRAARLIDLMEQRGIIGEASENSSKPRNVLSHDDDSDD